MKKVLLIGRGQIGSALERGLSRVSMDLWPGDLDELSQADLLRLAPDVVINSAGKTNLAWCEENAAEALRCNLEAPVRLFDRILAMRTPPRFLQLSSGCVWDGPYDPDGKPFTPSSAPSPAALYSWTKAACDAMLLARDAERVAILRPRQVYSADLNDRNMLVKLLRYPGLIDTPNSISSITTIVRTVQHLMNAEDWAGTWNVYDRGVVTPLEIGNMLASAGLREKPSIISKEELDIFHHPRRVDTVLYDARFEAAIAPPDAREELLRAIEGLKEHVRAEAV
jgi:dTDP-4-dehydrorhamnose reductase